MGSEWRYIAFREICAHSAFGPRFSSEEYAVDGNVACLRTMDMITMAQLTLKRCRSQDWICPDLQVTFFNVTTS